jgi:hypothetical protein
LVRFASILAAAGALATCGPAWAAPEITLAAIATGRLYVVGTTERPHMPVVLEDKFRTESDDKGKFQYELVYHPSRCIVAATIDGKAVEAVVSNCGQQCVAASQNAAAGAAAPRPALPGRMGSAATANPAAGPPQRALQQNRSKVAAPPERPRAAAASEPSAMAPAGQAAGVPKKVQVERAPRPPQRPVAQTPPQARAAQPAKPARKPRPSTREAPDDTGPPIAD